MLSDVTRTPGCGFFATLGGLVAGWPARRPSTPARGSGRLRNTVAQCTVRCCREPPLRNRTTPGVAPVRWTVNCFRDRHRILSEGGTEIAPPVSIVDPEGTVRSLGPRA